MLYFSSGGVIRTMSSSKVCKRSYYKNNIKNKMIYFIWLLENEMSLLNKLKKYFLY